MDPSGGIFAGMEEEMQTTSQHMEEQRQASDGLNSDIRKDINQTEAASVWPQSINIQVKKQQRQDNSNSPAKYEIQEEFRRRRRVKTGLKFRRKIEAFNVSTANQLNRKNKASDAIFGKQQKFEDPKEATKNLNAKIQGASQFVQSVLDKYTTYTSKGIMPSSLVSNYKNLVDVFKREFPVNAASTAGYFTDDDLLLKRNKSKGSERLSIDINQGYLSGLDVKKMGMDLRETIEKHSAAQKKLYQTQSVWESLKRGSSDQASPQALSSNPRMKKIDRKPLVNDQVSQKSERLKVNSFQINNPNSASSLLKGFKLRMSLNDEAPIDPRTYQTMKQRLAETVDEINDRLFKPMSQPSKPKFSKDGAKSEHRPFNFAQQRREWENSIDAGISFCWMSEKFPIKKEWQVLMTCVKEKEQDRKENARQRQEIIAKLHQQGVYNEDTIKEQVNLKIWQLKKQQEKKKQSKFVVNDPTKISIHMSQLTHSCGSNDEGGTQLEQDFKGIETNFQHEQKKPKKGKQVEENQDRNIRVIKARERLNKKRTFKEDENFQNRNETPEVKLEIEAGSLSLKISQFNKKSKKHREDKAPFSLEHGSIFEKKDQITLQDQEQLPQDETSLKTQSQLELISEINEKLVFQQRPVTSENPYQAQQTRDRYRVGINNRVQNLANSSQMLHQMQPEIDADNAYGTHSGQKRGKSAIPGGIRSQPTDQNASGTLPSVWIENMVLRKSMGYKSYQRQKTSKNVRSMTQQIKQDILMKRKMMKHMQESSAKTRLSETQAQSGTNNEQAPTGSMPDMTSNRALSSIETHPSRIQIQPFIVNKTLIEQQNSFELSRQELTRNTVQDKQNQLSGLSEFIRLYQPKTDNHMFEQQESEVIPLYIKQRMQLDEIENEYNSLVQSRQEKARDYSQLNKREVPIMSLEKEIKLLKGEATVKPQIDFVYYNTNTVGHYSSRTDRNGNHLQHLRKLKLHRKYQDHPIQKQLLNNIQSYETVIESKEMPFQMQMALNPALEVMDRNELRAMPSSNDFTRHQSWNLRLNCPYYGLVKLRENQQSGINYKGRDDVILREHLLPSQQMRRLPSSVQALVDAKNQSTQNDGTVHKIIEGCLEAERVPWKYLLKEL